MKKFFLIITLLIGSGLLLNAAAQTKPKVFELNQYGVIPNTGVNITPLINKALQQISEERSKEEPILVKLKKGRYDFHPEGAERREYYISNHDQDNPKLVGIALEEFNNITIDGQGADLFFHGRMLPISLISNENVTLKNLHIDFEKPQIAQVKIIENDTLTGSIIFETAPWVSYVIKDSIFYNAGESWELHPVSGIAFEEKTKRIIFQSGDIAVGTKHVSEIAPGRIKAHRWLNPKLIPGTVVAMRTWQRPNPGIFVHRGKDIKLENIYVHFSEGMGLLAQLSENIYMDNFNVSLRGKNDPRYFTTQADATHFSGCKGIIVSNNGLYEGMMDDAINIHGTYLKIIKRLDDQTLIGRYMHEQAYGFDWGEIGDSVQFIKSKTMEYWNNKNTIKTIEILRENESEPIREFKISLNKPLDKDVDPENFNIGIENLTWTPQVEFIGNTIRNNRARGALFSTPKPTLVENNLFDHTSGTAILLCGDSNGWYETGACRNIIIRNNTFINALTSMYQFTNAIISIYPEIPDLENQKKYFHSGIRIENNKFQTFDKPVLYAKSVDGITFKNNKITTNKQYPAFHKNKDEILFERVIDAEISGNTINKMPLNYTKE